jgi:adenylate kinase
MKDALVYMRRGELMPDATVWEMVRERAECLHCAGGFILDGFARTMAQAVSLKQFLDKDRLGVTAVISYELPRSEIVSGFGGRRPVRSASRCFTSREGRRKWEHDAIAAPVGCFSAKMTARSRSKFGSRLTAAAPRR